MKQITEREAMKATMRDLGFSEADIRAEEVRVARKNTLTGTPAEPTI